MSGTIKVGLWLPFTAGSHGALLGADLRSHRASVSIFSYRGEVTVGLMVVAALIPDPNRIVTQLERELTALSRLGRDHLRPERRPRRPATRPS